MDLLVYLAEHPNQVVTKDQILEDVWRQRFVAESVLSRSIADLRHLLEDEAQAPRVIETIPKRGYRLVAAVARHGPTLTATSPAAARRPSVVVLPFLDLAPGRDQEYFCDGLSEELTNRLAHLRGLRVVARTSAFAFKGRPTDVREIGRTLGVGAVLEGSVQRAGDRLRVTAQLIDVSDGCHIWSGRFDGAARDVFAIEDEIAQALVSELRVKLLGGPEARVMHRRTSNPAAHDLYLRGRRHATRRSFEGLEQAARCYEQAIALDPEYAAAHAGIAECCCVTAFFGFRPAADTIPRTKESAERALAIDPDLVEAHAILGHVSGMFGWDWGKAEGHFLRALELSPGYSLTRTWYSHLLTASGRFDEAIAQTERACECDPLAPTVQTTLGLALYYARRFDRARECYSKVIAADPSFALARFHLGRLHRTVGDFESAVEQFRLVGMAIPLSLGCLAESLRQLGREEEAGRAVAELERLSRARYVSPLAWGLASSDLETRLRWFTRAFEEREGDIPLLNADPVVDYLSANPTFRGLLDRLGLPRLPLGKG